MKTVISKLRTALQIGGLVTIFSTAAFGIVTSPAQAQCKTVFGKEVCLKDIDPTRGIPGSKEVSERLWGEAGANAYQAAAKIMRSRHGGSVGLDDIQKKYLRPHYGSLVDQVVVVYNAKMMSEWSALGKNIKLSKVDSAAQAYCNRIYVKDSYQSGNRDQLLLLAHELRHAQQCQELGGEGKFGFHYFREYKRAGLNYENNSLEKSADERANSIASSIPNELIAVSFSQWQAYPGGGLGQSIAVSQDGTPFIIGTNQRIYKGSGSGFVELSGDARGTNIAIDGGGKAWIIGTNKRIFFHDGSVWAEYPGGGLGQSIAVSQDGTPFIIGTNQRVYKGSGNGWVELSSDKGKNIALDGRGNVWIIGINDTIYSYAP
jgi:hypothetical protein